MSFLRLKQIELGYTLPKNLTKAIYSKGVRFYVSGNNLLTFSKFKLWDPELDTANGCRYPAIKSVLIGINVVY